LLADVMVETTVELLVDLRELRLVYQQADMMAEMMVELMVSLKVE